MFYFWRGATAALVPGFLCQSGRRRPENVSILSFLVTSLDGINGRSIQTLWRGENDSKQSDEFQAILKFAKDEIGL